MKRSYIKRTVEEETLTYQEAIAVLNEETDGIHEESCFETGNCDIRKVADEARNASRMRKTPDNLKSINEAERVILAHIETYDREQIVPTKAG